MDNNPFNPIQTDLNSQTRQDPIRMSSLVSSTSAFLNDRAVLAVTGADAEIFLNRLLTQTVPETDQTRAAYAALLTPQGKVISDLFILRDPRADGSFLIDCPLALAPDLVKRLTLYRLRATVTIDDHSSEWGVTALWGDQHPEADAVGFADPRLPAMGYRVIGERGEENTGATGAYHARRIALGLPEGGKDYMFGSVFPHEINLDQLHGLAFDKGCYVGQEVVSRMEHRGLARNRVVPVVFPDGFAASEGIEVLAGTLPAGHLGSVTAGGKGLALLRLDRVAEAQAKGQPITAGGVALVPYKPDWAVFDFPISIPKA
jgi:folate-binding protein YgfZ